MKERKEGCLINSAIINICSSGEEAAKIRNEIMDWLTESPDNFRAWHRHYKECKLPGNFLSVSRETNLMNLMKMRKYMNYLINKD